MRVVLAGSPAISIATFEEIINNFDVVAIVTQPDRKKGRGQQISETDVSILAKKHNINIIKPKKINDSYEALKELNFDIFVTFAYGQIIPERILKLGKYKPVNIHGSLLPNYRGAAPIQRAILNGDSEIGITLIEMVKKMDAGDMYFKASKKISSDTTSGDAFEIISELARKNIVSWLNKIFKNNFVKTPQGDKYTIASKITKYETEIFITDISENAIRKIKGYNPFPGAYILIDGKRLKIYNASLINKKNSIKLDIKDNSIYITDYQWEGKKRITI